MKNKNIPKLQKPAHIPRKLASEEKPQEGTQMGRISLPQFSRLGLLYISCPNDKSELKRGRRLSPHQRLIHCPTIVLTVAWICNTCNTAPSHNTRPGLRIVMQEHEMLSGGITWLSSSASNYQIIKTGFFFFLKLFPVKTAQ